MYFLPDPSDLLSFSGNRAKHKHKGRETAAPRPAANEIVRVERRGDQVFTERREEAHGGAENATERAAGHESRCQNNAALANAAAVLAAGFFRAPVDEMRQDAAGKDGRSEPQRKIDAQREDHGGFAEHFKNERNKGADAKEHIGDRLAAHEAHDKSLHDGGLRRGQNLARVTGRSFAKLEGVGEQDDGEAGGDGSRGNAEKLDLLLRRGRGAEPVTDFEVGDELARCAQGGAHHARNRHDEEHAGGAGEAKVEQHHRGDNDREHGHAGGGIVGRGGDGVGGHRGKEEREDEREDQAEHQNGPGDLQAAEEDGDAESGGHHAEKDGENRDIAIGAPGVRGFAVAEGVQRDAKTSRQRCAAI